MGSDGEAEKLRDHQSASGGILCGEGAPGAPTCACLLAPVPALLEASLAPVPGVTDTLVTQEKWLQAPPHDFPFGLLGPSVSAFCLCLRNHRPQARK